MPSESYQRQQGGTRRINQQITLYGADHRAHAVVAVTATALPLTAKATFTRARLFSTRYHVRVAPHRLLYKNFGIHGLCLSYNKVGTYFIDINVRAHAQPRMETASHKRHARTSHSTSVVSTPSAPPQMRGWQSWLDLEHSSVLYFSSYFLVQFFYKSNNPILKRAETVDFWWSPDRAAVV